VFITGSSKRAIEDHFDTDGELESLLLKQGKSDLLNTLRSVLPSYASCIYIRQSAPLGLGHAVLCAKPAVGNAPFFVHLADDLIDAKVPCLRQMADRFDNGSIVAVQTVPRSQTDKYGIVKSGARHDDLLRVERIVEKPKPAQAPSNLAVWAASLLTRGCSHTSSASAKAGGNPAHRRYCASHGRRSRVCIQVRRQALRLRQQAGVPAGQRRIRAGACGGRHAVPQVPARSRETNPVIRA
jgi:UTP--glucose-1-phosphate uridylyltransferase